MALGESDLQFIFQFAGQFEPSNEIDELLLFIWIDSAQLAADKGSSTAAQVALEWSLQLILFYVYFFF